ncbi:hypothetical protein AAVH_08717 [Aphelenchoides avenae]|nr:hypothetical protein AAVH_08717 [Aphelenchus avenae]
MTTRFRWILVMLVVGTCASGDDGQPPDKNNGDGHSKKDKDAALPQVAQVARRCHNADVSAATAMLRRLVGALLRKDSQIRTVVPLRTLAVARLRERRIERKGPAQLVDLRRRFRLERTLLLVC